MNQKKKMSTRNIWLIGITCILMFIIGTVVIYDNFRYVLRYFEDEAVKNDEVETDDNSKADNIKEDEKMPLDEDIENSDGAFTHFVDMTKVEITYATELESYDCKIDSNGFLQGACAIDEVKNKRFVNLMIGNEPFIGNIFALGVDGFVYDIGFKDAESKVMILNDSFKPMENITKMGFIRYNTTDCEWLRAPIYISGNQEYIMDIYSENIEENKYILLTDEIKNNMPISSIWACGYTGNEIFIDTTISINKNLILSNGVIVKDNETKNNIEVKYSVYQYINGKESLHIISNDNKYYILIEETEYVSKEDNIKNINLQNNYLTLNLEDGRMVVLALYSGR